MRNVKHLCLLCLLVQLFLPVASAFAQPMAEAKSAFDKLLKYRSDGDPESLKAALRSVDSLISRLDGSKDTGLETLSAAAYAADTAYQATGDEKYLKFAERLASSITEKLNTGPVRSGPEGAVAIGVLMDLYYITGTKAYKEEAAKAVDGLTPGSPAAEMARETCYEFIVVGRLGTPGLDELIRKSFMYDDPCRVVVVLDPGRNRERLVQLGYEYPGRPCLFVCSDKTCFPPVYAGEDLTRIRQSIKKIREMK